MTQPSPSPSPLAGPEPWNIVAEAYAEEIAPMFENFAREALDIAGVSEGTRVADVAAGPGTLALLAAQRGASVCAVDFSEPMLRQLRARALGSGLHVDAVQGDGTKLPWASDSFDAGFSMFGLMFFPDRHAGFRELARVLRPGARAVVSSWVDTTKVPLLAAVFGTFGESMPGPASPPREMPLADAEACRVEMTAGGFADVTVRESSFPFPVPSTAALVDSMIRSSAPVALARKQIGEGWPAVESKWRGLLQARIGDGPHELVMPAHLICGVR